MSSAERVIVRLSNYEEAFELQGKSLKLKNLARISNQPTAACAHLPESTALRSDKGLDVLYSTPARFVSRAHCISGHLRALASRSGEKCGLAPDTSLDFQSQVPSPVMAYLPDRRYVMVFPSLMNNTG